MNKSELYGIWGESNRRFRYAEEIAPDIYEKYPIIKSIGVTGSTTRGEAHGKRKGEPASDLDLIIVVLDKKMKQAMEIKRELTHKYARGPYYVEIYPVSVTSWDSPEKSSEYETKYSTILIPKKKQT